MLSGLPSKLPHHVSLRLLKGCLRLGDLDRARHLFDRIPDPDLRLWTALISGYTRQGLPRESIRLYAQLLREKGLKPDKYLLLPVVKACAVTSDLRKAKEIHADAVSLDLHTDLLLGNALIDMYGKCGYPQGAKDVFDNLSIKDVISWTSVIAAYVNSNVPGEALHLFRDMGFSGVRPNSTTLSTLLPACLELKSLNFSKEIHGFAVRNGLDGNAFVSSALVDAYARCVSLKQARAVFDRMTERDTVSWNVILSAHFLTGDCREALNIFGRMKAEGTILDRATWNTMIGGCMQSGEAELVLKLLSEMQDSGFKPNNMTIASVLSACSKSESLRGGKEIHGYSFRHRFLEDIIIATALMFMYAKCGDLDFARHIFGGMPQKDIVVWNTIILANSMHGCGEEALSLFNKMIDSGMKPNSVTLMAVLSGCSHSQLVDEGRSIFDTMKRDYGVEPDVDHYSCMVDILCRSGRLEDAYEFIQQMPLEPSPGAWGALLAGSKVYKHVKLGSIAANKLFDIEPNNPGNYVLLSNIYVAAKQWDAASQIRKMMRDRGIVKEAGCSWIQINNQLYTFVKGGMRGARIQGIQDFLKEIQKKMKLEGYLPDTDFVLQDVDEEEKEEVLCSHSEKLAVALGILNLNGKLSIKVFKNLRICGDCHNVVKFISKTSGVLITVRDTMRFHHFKDGSCSCGDNW